MSEYHKNEIKFDHLSINQIHLKRLVLFLTICITLLSCSNDSSDDEIPDVEEVDLTIVEGRYKGAWKWELGDGLISMIITQGEAANRYNVEYFESNNYLPRRRSDGVSPDARGELIVDGMNVSIDLDHLVDDPPCPGKFTGTGTFNENGELAFTMNIDDCFAENEPATWQLEKQENL